MAQARLTFFSETKMITSLAALIVIYNHQYNRNIDIIEEIYKDRFSHIFHLMPFYQGHKNNVIPVYENSRYFQGYVAQGLKSFFRTEFKHYFDTIQGYNYPYSASGYQNETSCIFESTCDAMPAVQDSCDKMAGSP